MSGYILTLNFKEKERPYMRDVSGLLYDFEKLYDLSVIVADEEYSNFRFSRFFYYRGGSPVKPKHSLKAVRIVKESPLLLEIAVGSTTGLWLLLQIIEKIQNWNLNNEKLELEVRKLRREEGQQKLKTMDLHSRNLERYIEERGASDEREKLVKRLSKNPIILHDIEITPDEFGDDD